ncbi:MAG TPA: iron-sulfur cluster biosynthesis protein [Pseudonocardiaceae bacterium]|jgi:iron-sulfur cluster assembly protein
MLTVTEAAAQAIKSLIAEHRMPEEAGLRISRQGDSTRSEGLGLSIAAAPAADDSVVESNSVKVFLPPNMVKILEDQQIDIEHVTEDGEEQMRFIVDRKPRSSEN